MLMQTLYAETQPEKPVQEVVAMCVFILSCLTYQNVPGKDISKIFGRCQEDRMLPLLTCLFNLCLAQYLCLSQILKNLPGW